MDLMINIIGYGFIFTGLILILCAFVKLLSVGLDALTKNDD